MHNAGIHLCIIQSLYTQNHNFYDTTCVMSILYRNKPRKCTIETGNIEQVWWTGTTLYLTHPEYRCPHFYYQWFFVSFQDAAKSAAAFGGLWMRRSTMCNNYKWSTMCFIYIYGYIIAMQRLVCTRYFNLWKTPDTRFLVWVSCSKWSLESHIYTRRVGLHCREIVPQRNICKFHKFKCIYFMNDELTDHSYM